MSTTRFATSAFALLLGATFLTTPAMAQEHYPKWEGHFELEGKWGNNRDIGEGGFFLPFWQTPDALIFTDIRGRFDDNSSREYNLGLGYRKIINDDLILGGYGFYDHRRTPSGNRFDQLTLGAEALTQNNEARLNLYLPETSEKNVAGSGTSLDTSGGNFQIDTLANTERAMRGVDVEFGARFEIGNSWDLWAYGGGFYFNASDYDRIAGPRGRLELSYNNLPFLNEGSRLTVGLESQYDGERNHQTWGLARVRVPFGTFANVESTPLHGIDNRMTSRVYRDVDIVSSERSRVVSSETASYGSMGSSFVMANASENLQTVLNNADVGTLIVLDGRSGIIENNGSVNMLEGQSIIGGGHQVSLTGDNSGATYNVILPGSRPTIRNVGGGTVLNMHDDTTLVNANIAGGANGIDVVGRNNVHLNQVSVEHVGMTGINVASGSSDVLMQDITVSNTGSSGIRINDASFVTVENSNISSVGNNGMDIRDSFDIAVSGTNIDGVTGIYAGIWIDNVNDFSFNHSHIRNVNNYGLSLNNLNTISGAGNSMSNVTTPCDHDSFTNGSIDFVSINDGAGGHCP